MVAYEYGVLVSFLIYAFGIHLLVTSLRTLCDVFKGYRYWRRVRRKLGRE